MIKKRKKFDLIFWLMVAAVFVSLIGTSFADYNPTTFLLIMIMMFCWDISDTARKMYSNMKSRHDFYEILREEE